MTTYKPLQSQLLTRPITDRAYRKLSPAERELIDHGCHDIAEYCRSYGQSIGVGISREIVAAVGRMLVENDR